MTVTKTEDPIAQFKAWLAEARESEPNDPEAMVLATATPTGAPSARKVLLKDVDQRGFTFYTNLDSRKGTELRANPVAALTFHWKSLRRQVRIEGKVEGVDATEADAYFATRARLSQIGAWASKQSHPLEGRFELEKRVARYTAKFHVGAVPRPDNWSGFRLVPTHIELWKSVEFRLHDRVMYHRGDDGWTSERLYP